MQPLCSPFASFPPLRPPHFHSWGRETSLSCSFARDRLKKAPEAVFPAPGIRALRKMSKHLKKKSEGASLANRPVCSPPLCRLVPLSILLEICVGQGVCFAPRALARQIARSALGRLSVVPNLAAIVFRLVVAERASFACVFFFPLARSKEKNPMHLAPHRTAPTSPSSCSTRDTSCTASSAARRRTTTPGSSTSWIRVSFLFLFWRPRIGCKRERAFFFLLTAIQRIKNTGYPGSERFFLHYADLIDFGSLCQLLR